MRRHGGLTCMTLLSAVALVLLPPPSLQAVETPPTSAIHSSLAAAADAALVRPFVCHSSCQPASGPSPLNKRRSLLEQDVASFHAASADGLARTKLLRALYRDGDAATEALRRYAEQRAAADSCSSNWHREGQMSREGDRPQNLTEGLQRLRDFAAAVRQHLPPRDGDAPPVVVVGAGPAGLLTAVEASVRSHTRLHTRWSLLFHISVTPWMLPRLDVLVACRCCRSCT
jgi:hypothetical protein